MRRILIENNMVDPKKCSYGFPWKSDSICMNFRMPEECVLTSDIDKVTDKDNIETLVIGCELDSYDFISDMVNLEYLYIYTGENIKNLDFTKKLVFLQQLYIVGTHISDLAPLYSLAEGKKRFMKNEPNAMKIMDYVIDGICIDTDCEIDNTDSLLDAGVYISELIIGKKRVRRKKGTG